MKHIIVIETADGIDGSTPRPIPSWLEEFIQTIVDQSILDQHGICVVHTKFNVASAIAAVHEMYGAPTWNPNYIPPQALEVCEWHGRDLGRHDWVGTVDGYQRCQKCKFERTKQDKEQ